MFSPHGIHFRSTTAYVLPPLCGYLSDSIPFFRAAQKNRLAYCQSVVANKGKNRQIASRCSFKP